MTVRNVLRKQIYSIYLKFIIVVIATTNINSQ